MTIAAKTVLVTGANHGIGQARPKRRSAEAPGGCMPARASPCAQKLLPAKAALDVPLALAITGLGIWIILAPWPVPGLTPPM